MQLRLTLPVAAPAPACLMTCVLQLLLAIAPLLLCALSAFHCQQGCIAAALLLHAAAAACCCIVWARSHCLFNAFISVPG
jgi:hypothetical protein